MSSYTKGEWTAHHGWANQGPHPEYPDWCEVIIKPASEENLLGRHSLNGHFGMANARLIAAAPDLLEALRCAAQSAGFQYMTYETRDLIDAALAKATGSQP